METQNLEALATSEENSRTRAEIWGDFVNWEGRRQGENGFLLNQLKEHDVKKVLDVALGDGVDTIYLLQQGFDVSSNEVDSAFRQTATQNAQRLGFNIQPTALDWRKLTDGYGAGSFDAIISFGNSFTCLHGRDNHLKALSEFRNLLKPGGLLIIDERNYQRILDNREAALSGELHSTGKYLYTGTDKIAARFLEITNDGVTLEYANKENGKKAYYWKLYPFKKGELRELLQETGFSNIHQLSDYREGDDSEADFYQYVCIK